MPTKNGFPFPPEVILGGFLFGDEPPRTDVNNHAACIQVFALAPKAETYGLSRHLALIPVVVGEGPGVGGGVRG